MIFADTLLCLVLLTLRAGAVAGDSDLAFGEGAHIVEHVEGGFGNIHAQTRDKSARQGAVCFYKQRLYMEDIGAHRRT